MSRTLHWAIALAFVATTGVAEASDHVDSPGDVPDPSADITDVYAFVPAEGKLALILNSFMNAGPGARFSDAVTYQLSLVPLTAEGKPEDRKQAYRLGCTFTKAQDMTCRLVGPDDAVLAEASGKVEAEPADGPLRVFAGRRRDPFFIDPTQVGKKRDPQAADAFTGKNSTEFVDLLAIVVEMDRSLLDKRPYFGVFGEILSKRGDKVAVVDRAGRIEITNLTIGGAAESARWNREKTLELSDEAKSGFAAALTKGIRRLDGLDGRADWTDQLAPALVALYLDDYLWLDVDEAAPQQENAYFSLELQALRGQPLTAPGGRRPNDDTMDVYLTLHIGGPSGPARQDGIPQGADPATSTFPFLKKPYLK